VNFKSLAEKKLVKKIDKHTRVKIVADKDKIEKKLIIDKEIPLSASAKKIIEKAGGTIK
jgi:ribosomal protein L15